MVARQHLVLLYKLQHLVCFRMHRTFYQVLTPEMLQTICVYRNIRNERMAMDDPNVVDDGQEAKE